MKRIISETKYTCTMYTGTCTANFGEILVFNSPDPKGHVSFCYMYHEASVVVCHPLTFHILIFSSETNRPIRTKLNRDGPWVVSEFGFNYRIVSDDPAHRPRWPPWLKIENSAKKFLKNILLWNCWANWDQTFDGIVLRWSPLRIVSVDPARNPKLPITRLSVNIGPYGKNI